MKTRSRKATTKSGDKGSAEPAATVQKLESSVADPPKVFILAQGVSDTARILTLPNPATSIPNRYLLCPDRGFYEITRVAAPKKACRSWLLAPDRRNADAIDVAHDQEEGYVLQTPDMMVATQIDPIFLLLPALTADETSGRNEHEYLSASDYLDRLGERSHHFRQMLQSDMRGKLESLLEGRLRTVCEVMNAGEERLYSHSKRKLIIELVEKAKRMVSSGLPASMEERFVKRELAVPMLSIKRDDSSLSTTTMEESASTGAESQSTSQCTSQDTQSSATTSLSASTTATSVASAPNTEAPQQDDELVRLLRLRTALDLLLRSYIAPKLRAELETLLKSSGSVVDFTPLDAHLQHINKLRKEAQALRSMSDNISRKRSATEDDEALEKAEAKKRKKEEEEIKKKNTSRGVQQLKKADTSGMKKLSSFFAAKPAAKKT